MEHPLQAPAFIALPVELKRQGAGKNRHAIRDDPRPVSSPFL